MSGDHPSLSPVDVEPWVAAASRDYRQQSKNKLWSAATRTALASLKGASDYQELLRRTDEHLAEITRARSALQRVRARVEEAADWHDTAGCFCDIWLERRRRDVLREAERSPGQGRRAWLDAYARALALDGYDACRRLTLQPWARTAVDEDLGLLARFRTGAVALKDGRPGDAVAMLTELAEDSRGRGEASPHARAVAMVLLARIHLYRLSDVRTARSWCARGLGLKPDEGRLHAVRGECLRADGSLEEAEQAFLSAIDADRSLSDGYVGMGLVSQDRRRWHQSRDWYDDALDAAGDDAALGLLLAPAPGNLYWQLGRRLRTHEPARALEALDCALRLGVAWWKGHPKRKVFADRGDILLLLERRGEAAASYYEAGRRYCWIGEARAGLPLLRRACELDPEHAPARWQLSDALRLLSYRPDFPYVDQELAQEAADLWDRGLRIRRPDESTAWAFLTRALLNEQFEKLTSRLGACYWETVRLLEQAVLLSPSYATAWAYLGQHHRLLGNLATARHATERALAIDPSDLSALEQHAAVLLQQADYAGAEQFALRRLDRAREPFPELVAATAMLMSGRSEQALEVLDDALAAVPDDVELRSWRALAHSVAGHPDAAREDHERVWGHRTGPLPRDLRPLVARAALHLGHVDAAVEHCTALHDVDVHGSAPLAGGLGLALLVRRSRDDVAHAAHLLRSGIEATQQPHPLRVLSDLLVPATRALAGPRLTDEDRAMLADVSRLARARSDVLVQHPRTAAQELADVLAAEVSDATDDRRLAAAAGLARLALDERRAEEAADRYAVLVQAGDVPEAECGLLRAAERLRDELDARGPERLDSVGEDALRLARLLEEAAPGQRQLLAELRARAGMSALLCRDTSRDRAQLSAVAQLLPAEAAAVVTAAAGQQLMSSPAQYWLAVDRLRELAVEPDVPTGDADHLLASAQRLDLSRLLPVSAAHVDPTAVFPIPPPLVLRLGEQLFAAPRSHHLDDALARLRDRVEADTGVRMPSVLVEPDPELPPSGYAIDVRGPVRSGVLPDAGSAVSTAVDELEVHVRRRLPTLLRLDDVAAMVTAGPSRTGNEWDSASLLRLYRALQSLVADGVRLTADVLATLAEQVQVHDAPEAAARARLRHRGQLPGNAPDVARTSLPPTLTTRLEDGLQAGAPDRWQLPRAQAVALLADVRTWSGARPGGPPQAVVVPSGELRPFAARLLAAALPGVPIVCEEEQHGRDGLVAGEPQPGEAVAATARADAAAPGAPGARPRGVGPARQ